MNKHSLQPQVLWSGLPDVAGNPAVDPPTLPFKLRPLSSWISTTRFSLKLLPDTTSKQINPSDVHRFETKGQKEQDKTEDKGDLVAVRTGLRQCFQAGANQRAVLPLQGP